MRYRYWASLALALALLGAGALGTVGWFFQQRNARLAQGWPDLVMAAREGRSGEIAALAARGTDLDRYDSGPNEWTPLLHAVHKNQLASVRALIAAGADVNRPAPNGLTPLALAAGQGEAEVVDELLAAGADPGARSSHGWTPLQKAVARGDERIVQALLQEDPSLSLGNGWRDHSVRFMAWVQGRSEVLDRVAPHQEASK